MTGGIVKRIGAFFKAMGTIARGTDTHSSRTFTSEYMSPLHNETRETWMEASPAHKLYGEDTYHLARIKRTSLVVNAGAPITLTTFERRFLKNLDGTPALHSLETALVELKKFEDTMETRCEAPPQKGSAVYKRATSPDSHFTSPAISPF